MKADYPRLLFEVDFDERTAFEVECKGWCGISVVALPNGDRFKVFFYDPGRLAQDLEVEMTQGKVCIAEPGMIVIPTLTRDNMQKAVNQLYAEGYFDSLVPLSA